MLCISFTTWKYVIYKMTPIHSIPMYQRKYYNVLNLHQIHANKILCAILVSRFWGLFNYLLDLIFGSIDRILETTNKSKTSILPLFLINLISPFSIANQNLSEEHGTLGIHTFHWLLQIHKACSLSFKLLT